jgi:hypothetical protein
VRSPTSTNRLILIRPTTEGPRYATRTDFVHGEDVTIGDWAISTENLPRYKD